MGLFDRLRRQALSPSTTRRALEVEPGPLTAHEAWDVVRPAARALDPRARLILVTSGLDIRPDGRSRVWEFGFDLPSLDGAAHIGVEPAETDGDIDDAPVVLVQRVRPLPATEVGRRPTLPEQFRDSPEVVAEFASRGVDYTAGPTDMKLEGRILPTGEAVWVTYDWDEEQTTAFGIGTDPHRR